jgi:hypothetical protein
MTRLIPLLALSLGGCVGIDPNTGLIVFAYGVEVTTSSTTCTENFTSASCPEGDEVGDTPWTFETQLETSEPLAMAEILGGEDDNVFLIVTGEVIPGKLEKGVYTFTWTRFANGSETTTHEDGFFTEESGSTETVQTITMERSEDDDTMFTGTWTMTSNSSATTRETDEWDSEEVGLSGGEGYFGFLTEDGGEGFVDNRSDENECDGDTCEVTRTETSTTTTPLSAWRAFDGSVGNYTDFDGVSQNPGSPF